MSHLSFIAPFATRRTVPPLSSFDDVTHPDVLWFGGLCVFFFFFSRLLVKIGQLIAGLLGAQEAKCRLKAGYNFSRLVIFTVQFFWQFYLLSIEYDGWLSRLFSDRHLAPAGGTFYGPILWRNWPHEEAMGSEARLMLVAQFAFYVQDLFPPEGIPSLSYLVENLVHHGISFLLLYNAYFYQYYFIISCGFILLDGSNVLLYLAKFINYCADEKGGKTFFVIFAVGFLVCRILIYPWIVYSLIVDRPLYLPQPIPLYLEGCILTTALFFLFLFWFAQILRVAFSSSTPSDRRKKVQ
eukprot:GILI01010506.1.p1 GENE.GILI01010506.1~~GILI01010506.1.p1  ORF type:complete len:309 (-),score=100.52 GILI01010506.1:203-1090(-)